MTNDFNMMSAFEDVQLTEDIFEADIEGAEEFKDFIDRDEKDDTVEVIDINAEDEEEVEPTYIGDAVILCPTCRNTFFKKDDEIEIEENEEEVAEEHDIVNVGEECPICGNIDGFHLIGKIVPYTQIEVSIEDKPEDEEVETDVEVKDEEEVEVEESLKEGNGCDGKECKEEVEEVEEVEDEKEVIESLQKALNKFAQKFKLSEDIETVSVDDDHTKVNIDIKKDEEEMGIEPVEPEEFVDVPDIAPEEDEFEDEDEFEEIDVDEVEEESLSRAIRNARPQFENYRVKKIVRADNKLCVESIARRRDGKIVKESIVLEPHSKKGDKYFFMTSGLRNNFIVECKIENKNLIVESFKRERR